MPTHNYSLSERSSELHCFSSDLQHKLPFGNISLRGSRASRSSSVSSTTGSVYSDVSLASSATSYSGLSYARDSDLDSIDYSDDESFTIDESVRTDVTRLPPYELQSKNRTSDTALTLGIEPPFDPQSRMSSPADEEQCTTPGPPWKTAGSSRPAHAVLYDGYAHDQTPLTLGCLPHDGPYGERTHGVSSCSFTANSSYASASLLTGVQVFSQTESGQHENRSQHTKYLHRDSMFSNLPKDAHQSSFATRLPHSQGLPHLRSTTELVNVQEFSGTSQGLQRLSSNSRRTKTDASWCKPPLVRQEIRKRSYVQTLIDVAVSLIAHIWPASERPLQVHNSTTGTTVIDLHYFVEQILRRSYASHSTLQLALYYCCKLSWSGELPQRSPTIKAQTNSKRDLPLLCGRRMFLASLMLAFKFLQDRNYSSRAWATISGLSIADINQNEFRLLEAFQYRTFVSSETYHRWQKVVEAQADQVKLHGSTSWRGTMSLYNLQGGHLICDERASLPYKVETLPAINHSDWSVPTTAPQATRSDQEEDRASMPQYSQLLPPPGSSPSSTTTIHADRLGAPVVTVGYPAIDDEAEVASAAAIDLPPISKEEDMAACISLPHSPGDMGPVAPPAPRLGTVTPPESLPDQAGPCANLLRIIKNTINDHDSGYDSSSPRSNCSEQFGNSQMAHGTNHLPDEAEDQWCSVVVEPDHCVASDQLCLHDQVRKDLCCKTGGLQAGIAMCDRSLTSSNTSQVSRTTGLESSIETAKIHSAPYDDEGYDSEGYPSSASIDKSSLELPVESQPTVVIGDCSTPEIDETIISRDELYDDYDLEQYENDMDDGKGLRQHKSKKHAAPPHGRRFYTLAQAIQKRSHDKACGQSLATSQVKTPKRNKKVKLGPC